MGRRVAVLFTKTYSRLLAPGLTALDVDILESIAQRSRLATAWRRFEDALSQFMERGLVAA